MKIIDANGRFFGKLNIIDFFVIFLAVCAAAGLFYRLNSKETTAITGGNDVFYVTFCVEKVRQFSIDAVNEGDIIYEQHGQKLGVVTRVQTGAAHKIVSLNDGTSAYFPMRDKYDLFFTIEASGVINESGFYINGNNHMAAGHDVKIQSNMILTTAKVYSTQLYR